MQLDADFASSLESSFGPCLDGRRPGEGLFPGAFNCRIPAQLAKILHHYWREQVKDSLSIMAAEAAAKDAEELAKNASPWSTKRPPQEVTDACNNQQEERQPYAYNEEETYDEQSHTPVTRQDIEALKERRAELYQKAASAFKSKQGGVAAYYSEEGRSLSDKIHNLEQDFRYDRFARQQASTPATLDLHGLSTSEAMEQLEWFVELKLEELSASGRDKLKAEVITGRGTRSTNRNAKIKPAAEAMLARNGIDYSEANPGSLDVIFRRRVAAAKKFA